MLSDIQGHWANTAINLLVNKKTIKGYPDSTFRPNAPVNRAEFATLMCQIFTEAPNIKKAISYTDIPHNHWAKSNIEKATRQGFFAGYPDGKFQPQQPIPRVQALIVLSAHLQHRIPQNPEEILTQYFDDAVQIPPYAREKIAAGAIENLVVNYPHIRQLNPNQNATRGEIAAFLCQALRLKNAVSWEYVAYSNLLVIPPKFDHAEKFSEGLAKVRFNNQNHFINTDGDIVLTLDSESMVAGAFSDGMATVKIDGKAGYIDRQGTLVIPAKFSCDPVYDFSEGLALAKLHHKEKWGYINKAGDWQIPPQFDNGGSFSQGRAKVSIGSQWGYIDSQSNWIIEAKFSEAGSFSESVAKVKLNDQWGYIDLNGDWVIPPEFLMAENFSNGVAKVVKDEKNYIVDKSGNITLVLPNSLASLQFDDELAPWGTGERKVGNLIQPLRYGYVDTTGKIIIQPQFYHAETFSEGFAVVQLNGHYDGGSWGDASQGLPPEYFRIIRGGKYGYIAKP